MERNELKSALEQEEKRLRAAYYYLGREYCKLLKSGTAPAIPALDYLVGKAGEFQANIDGLNAQLNPPAVPAAPAAPAAPVAPAAPAPAGKFCTSCGAPLELDAAFCTSCGAKQ